MTAPRVSVLIPCFNAEAYIGATLESVFSQTWPNLEVIVVDDGSTDRSADIVGTTGDGRVRLLRQSARGAAAARNRAFSEASGDFIQFLDADDLLDPGKIGLQMSRLQGRPTCIASAQWGRFQGDPGQARFIAETNWEDLDPVEWLLRSRVDGLGMLFPAIWLVPRAVAHAAGPWNETLTLGDDGEYFTRVALAAERVLFCEGARCRYRSSVSGSLSSSMNWASGYAMLDLCEGHVRTRIDDQRARRAFALSWQHLAHAAYPYDAAIAERALTRACALDSAKLQPDGGAAFKAISRLIGWRAARRLQVATGRR